MLLSSQTLANLCKNWKTLAEGDPSHSSRTPKD